MGSKLIKCFLRLALSLGFFSAVADRFGWWAEDVSAWGNWTAFLAYTQQINPWAPEALIPVLGFVATAAELVFAVCLLIGFRTELFARLSGYLLVLFGLSMAFSIGIKASFDYSVFSASAAAFALSTLKQKFMEVDNLFTVK